MIQKTETNISNLLYKDADLKRLFHAKTAYNQGLATVLGGIIQALWFFCDYFLCSEQWPLFLTLRLLVFAIPAVLVFYQPVFKITPHTSAFIMCVLTAILISFACNYIGEKSLIIYLFGFILLMLGVGLLAYWEDKLTIAFILVSIIALISFNLYYQKIPFQQYVFQFVFPIISTGLISFILIKSRYKIAIKEIKSKRELEISKNLAEKEKNKLKLELDNFVYSLSHDLRSPLLSVKGIISLIIDTEPLNENSRNLLDLADNSINKLDESIKTILDYSRNSRNEISTEKINITEFANAVYDELKHLYNLKSKFQIDINGDPFIFSDSYRMKIILSNIISNSLKYRNFDLPECIVHFSMKRENNKLFFVITDNGIGIPESDKEKVFEMFYRLPTNRTGTGLGLYLVKEVVSKLNGTISITSKLNQGTTVSFLIPDRLITN